MRKNKIAFVKPVVIAGFLFLCAAPGPASGQSSPPGAAPHPPMRSAARNSTAPPDLLEGLTLTDDQTAKIDQIREETKSRLAAVANDKKLSPEASDAMLRGYQRIEDGKILEVLTPEQQQEVRKRIAAWRAAAGTAAGKPQYPLRRPPVPEQTPQPK